MQRDESDLGQRANALLQRCQAQSIPIMLSSLVVAEMLAGMEEGSEAEFLRRVQRRFVSPNFDSLSAIQFARLWRSYRDRVRELQQEGLTRNRIRGDWFIVASALAQRASCIYSEDPHLHRCAQGLIEVRYLAQEPIPARQDPLPLT